MVCIMKNTNKIVFLSLLCLKVKYTSLPNQVFQKLMNYQKELLCCKIDDSLYLNLIVQFFHHDYKFQMEGEGYSTNLISQ